MVYFAVLSECCGMLWSWSLAVLDVMKKVVRFGS
jgi:hypothetical protein